MLASTATDKIRSTSAESQLRPKCFVYLAGAELLLILSTSSRREDLSFRFLQCGFSERTCLACSGSLKLVLRHQFHHPQLIRWFRIVKGMQVCSKGPGLQLGRKLQKPKPGPRREKEGYKGWEPLQLSCASPRPKEGATGTPTTLAGNCSAVLWSTRREEGKRKHTPNPTSYWTIRLASVLLVV